MQLNRANERRGVILMVVLSLLTLFAIVGVSFVLYADSQATTARIAREGETLQRADLDPEKCLAMFLGQLIYDVNDDIFGVGSGLCGHSLARTMYGYNYTTLDVPGTNINPYNGVGRLHTNPPTWSYMNPYAADDYTLVNYTWFSGDGFLRDPERYSATPRNNPTAQQPANSYVGGNAPYTYPDLDSFFLAAVRSDGTVLTPSFHRPWLFNPGRAFNDMTNPNWQITTPQGKYLTPRPRPAEHPGFPYPDDAFGDVKNLVGAPGGNDSIWIDIVAPVMTAPDGTQYKMLVAPLIMDLDNRINIAAAGNIEGLAATPATPSRSNHGWFPSEVNPNWLWSNSTINPTDWLNLFKGNGSYYGKYGPNLVPSGPLFAPGSAAHVYAQADLDGRNEQANGAATSAIQLPTVGSTTAPPNSSFPYFPVGYGSGSPAERTNHPAGYAVYRSPLYVAGNDDLGFRASDMEALLRPNGLTQTDTGGSALISNLLRLCPNTLSGTDATAPQRRNWITTVSSDIARPGISPWIYDPFNAASYNPLTPSAPFPYGVAATTPSLPPLGGTVPFPSITQRTNAAVPSGSDFTANWRGLDAATVLGSALDRIDLNRPLPPFPHMTSGTTTMMTNTPNDRFDVASTKFTQAQIQTQLLAAMTARQTLANDIYRRLLVVTGSNIAFNNPTNPGLVNNPPTAQQQLDLANLATRRWLAQLAANIVDYIDDDEISTPFNFYTTTDGLAAASTYQVVPTSPDPNAIPVWPATLPATTGNPDVPAYWVFGTELPRIVINEVLGEYTLQTNNAAPPAASNGANNVNVNIWVELFDPLPAPASVTAAATANQSVLQPQDSLAVPLYYPAVGSAPVYNPYQLVIANNNITANSNGLWMDTLGGLNNNILGTPQQIRYTVPPTAALPTGTPAVCSFGAGAGTVWTISNPANPTYSITAPTGGLPGQSIMLVGPSASGNALPYNDANSDITAANVTAAGGNPATVPWLQSPSMSYQVISTYTAATNTLAWSMYVPPPAGSPANTPPGILPINDNTAGVSVLLRRLANPHLPPNPFTAAGILTNPALPPNPYITVDYVNGAPLNGNGSNGTNLVPIGNFVPIPPTNSPLQTATPPGPSSFGKLQPYTANLKLTAAGQVDPTSSQVMPQTTAMAGTVAAMTNHHTLGLANAPLASPFTWLVHLDRILISPMELLHVSGFRPYELTQRLHPWPESPNQLSIGPPALQLQHYASDDHPESSWICCR